MIQLNCLITCRSQNQNSSFNKSKQIKQIINYEKHLSREATSQVNIPLHSQISNNNDPELILTFEYMLEAILINSNKKALISTSIPLFIGTTPCYRFVSPRGGVGDAIRQSYLCYDNFGE